MVEQYYHCNPFSIDYNRLFLFFLQRLTMKIRYNQLISMKLQCGIPQNCVSVYQSDENDRQQLYRLLDYFVGL